VAGQVYRHPEGSNLEGQETWRISGLERDVSIHAREKIRMKDCTIHSPRDESYQKGKCRVEIDLWNR
jgi:Beta-galactosidase/beta-glucuronidase